MAVTDEEKVERLARHMATKRGFYPDDMGTEMQMWSNDGVTVMPSPDFVRPIWTFYANEAREILRQVAELNKDSV
jgi:hypothetical protein